MDSGLGLFEDIEHYSSESYSSGWSKGGATRRTASALRLAAPEGGGDPDKLLDELLLTPPFTLPATTSTHTNGLPTTSASAASHNAPTAAAPYSDDFFDGGVKSEAAEACENFLDQLDSNDWGIPDEAADAKEQPPVPPPTPPSQPSSTNATPAASQYTITGSGGNVVKTIRVVNGAASFVTSAQVSANSFITQAAPVSNTQSRTAPAVVSSGNRPAFTQQQPHASVSSASAGTTVSSAPIKSEAPRQVIRMIASTSSERPAGSGSPVMVTAGGHPGLQMLNGQLVVQAQLQQVQTPNGIITVAVLPQGLVNNPGVQMQMQQLMQPAKTASPVPAEPRQPQIKPKPHRRKQALPSAPKKPKPPVRQPPPPQPARSRGGEMSVQLDEDSQAQVSALGRQICELRAAAGPGPLSNELQGRIADLERQRTDIISKAFLQQHGQEAAKELMCSSSPAAPPPQPSPAPPPIASAESLPPGAQIVNVNGQQYMMLSKEQAMAQGYAPPTSESGSTQLPAPMPMGASTSSAPIEDDLADLEREMELEQRRSNFGRCFESDAAALLRPEERSIPFRDQKEAIVRLMPYHLYSTPDPSPMFLASVDEALHEEHEQLMTEKSKLEARFTRALLKEAMVESAPCDESLISFLLHAHEEDLLKEERVLSVTDPEKLATQIRELGSSRYSPRSSSSSSSSESSDSEASSSEDEGETDASTLPPPSVASSAVSLPPTAPLSLDPLDLDSLPLPSARPLTPSLPSPIKSPPKLPPPVVVAREEPRPVLRAEPLSEAKPISIRIKPLVVAEPPEKEERPKSSELTPSLKLRIPKLRFKALQEAEKAKAKPPPPCEPEPGPSQPRGPLKLRIKQLTRPKEEPPSPAKPKEESLFERLQRASPSPEPQKPIRITVKLKRPATEEERDENHRRKRKKKKRKKERREKERQAPIPPIRLPAVPIWRQELVAPPKLFVPKLKIKLSQEEEQSDCRLVIDDTPEEEEEELPKPTANGLEASDSEESVELGAPIAAPPSVQDPPPSTASLEIAEKEEEEETEFSDEFPSSPSAGPSASNIFAIFQPTKYHPPPTLPPPPSFPTSQRKRRPPSPSFSEEASEDEAEDALRAKVRRLISTSALGESVSLEGGGAPLCHSESSGPDEDQALSAIINSFLASTNSPLPPH